MQMQMCAPLPPPHQALSQVESRVGELGREVDMLTAAGDTGSAMGRQRYI